MDRLLPGLIQADAQQMTIPTTRIHFGRKPDGTRFWSFKDSRHPIPSEQEKEFTFTQHDAPDETIYYRIRIVMSILLLDAEIVPPDDPLFKIPSGLFGWPYTEFGLDNEDPEEVQKKASWCYPFLSKSSDIPSRTRVFMEQGSEALRRFQEVYLKRTNEDFRELDPAGNVPASRKRRRESESRVDDQNGDIGFDSEARPTKRSAAEIRVEMPEKGVESRVIPAQENGDDVARESALATVTSIPIVRTPAGVSTNASCLALPPEYSGNILHN
jgi:hypothetical protein